MNYESLVISAFGFQYYASYFTATIKSHDSNQYENFEKWSL